MELKVKIKDPVLRCYASSLFQKKDDGYAVTMDTFTGAVICSLAKESPYPQKKDVIDKTTLKLYLPYSRYNDSLRNRFLTITSEGEAKINAVLKKEFETTFTTYCTEMKIQGYKIKDIIPTFITKYNLDILDGDIEMLKKKYYRKEIEILDNLHESLRQKAYSAIRKVKK